MLRSVFQRRIFRPLAVIVLPLAVGYACSHPVTVAKTQAPTPSPVAAAKPATPVVDATVKARRDSMNRANAASFAELEREAARSDSLNRASAAVMTRQSELRETLVAQLHFDVDQSKIRDTDHDLLDRKAAILLANQTVRLRISGNADDRADEQYDRTLGLQRAEEARRYLAEHGVDTVRLSVLSNGDAHPVCPDKRDNCQAENRRVEFSIIDAPNLLRPGKTVAK